MNPYITGTIAAGRAIKPVGGQASVDRTSSIGRTQKSFSDYLQKEINENISIRFSKHAEQRMISRNIRLSGKELESMDQAVEQARQKGIRDSLLLMDNRAFIVNIPSKTVITAAVISDVNKDSLKENIFTNIDGAVII